MPSSVDPVMGWGVIGTKDDRLLLFCYMGMLSNCLLSVMLSLDQRTFSLQQTAVSEENHGWSKYQVWRLSQKRGEENLRAK